MNETIELVNFDDGVGWIIPHINWHIALADAIETARDNDTILCGNESMVELGKRAHLRMCLQKKLSFAVNE